MKRFRSSCGLWAGLRGGVLAAALASVLAGCSLTDDVFGGPGNNEPSSTPQPVAGPAASTTPTASTTPSSGQAYPDLNSVPQQPPATSTTAQRQQVASGLVADNTNAAYSDQQVTASQQAGTPAPPPVPAPAPAPAAASGTDTGTVTTAPIPAPAPAVTTASQPAAGQTVTNQTATQTASAPSATVVPLPAATTAGATPMAPPPNPVPPAPSTTEPSTMAPMAMANASSSSVIVDTSQLGGSPLPGYQAAPIYSSGPLPTSPGGAPAYGLPAGTAPVAGQPVAVIYFNDASSAVSDRAQWVLRNVSMLQQQLGGRLRVVGNASLRTLTLDPQQHDRVNYKISQARANAVARTLISIGVPQGSIAVAAQGSQAPMFYEFMPTGEAANRRVDIFLDR